MVQDILHRARVELDLGAEPRVVWFADTRDLRPIEVRSLREVFVPADGMPKQGSVPEFVRYSPETGWDPAPLMLLNRSECSSITALHELRHLWQIKAGLYRADEVASSEIEADADAWADATMARLEALRWPLTGAHSPRRPPNLSPNRPDHSL
jgi:hypothetical protein